MELITKLTNTKERTLEFFELPDSDMGKTYGDGKWNIRQILNHLADVETVLYERIRRVISEPRPIIWAFDQDAWADKLRYNQFPLPINKEIYGSVRSSIIYLADEYYESFGGNEFVHSETGIRTLKDEFEKVAWHNQHHLNQIMKALKRSDDKRG